MVKIRIIDQTLPKMGEVIDLKVEKRNTSRLNREVGLHVGNSTARIIIVKAKIPIMLHMQGGPSKI